MLPFATSGCALTLAFPAAPRRSPTVCAPAARGSRRHVSASTGPAFPPSQPAALDVQGLDRWIAGASEKKFVRTDTLRGDHLADLYCTLPTRDGTRYKYAPPGPRLEYGHHLVFFHPRNPETALRADGTDADFCPPEPFTRRMWAGGKMVWRGSPLRVGDDAEAVAAIAAVNKKGFEAGTPMVFVKQQLQYRVRDELCLEEERNHVYLASPAGGRRVTREGKFDSRHGLGVWMH